METKKEQRLLWVGVIAQLLCLSSVLWAVPKTADEAVLVVQGWLYSSGRPLDENLGYQVGDVNTFTDPNGNPLFYVANLVPSGFVIVSADDLIEPIIAFADDGRYEDSSDSPLGALVNHDLPLRMIEAQAMQRGHSKRIHALSTDGTARQWGSAQEKWEHLLESSDGPRFREESPSMDARDLSIAGAGYLSINDMRVSPLTLSKWGQTTCEIAQTDMACYNYHTPHVYWVTYPDTYEVRWLDGDPDNFPCGCAATAMAQLMFFHRHPQDAVGTKEFEIHYTLPLLSESATNDTYHEATDMVSLRGGDGVGGPYQWNLMANDPSSPFVYDHLNDGLKAIGALCCDAGVSINMAYGPHGSAADTLDAADAFKDTFHYANAVKGCRLTLDLGTPTLADIGPDLNTMINPNLDAGHPVILGIRGPDGGHAVLADGYGYQHSTLYHHLNMGWRGGDDAWYNLPAIDSSYEFNVIQKCVYNIFPSKQGEIISGRVLNQGVPVPNVQVQTTIESWTCRGTGRNTMCLGSSYTIADVTDHNGIFALVGVPSDYTCVVQAIPIGQLLRLDSQTVTTGSSQDYATTCGNVWAVNFYAQ
ncbi:MAG: C10 family peptidase [Phycisphaerales bacterium]